MTAETFDVRVQLEGPGYLGEAVGHLDGQVLFVDYGLPGEEVLAEIQQRKRRFAHARAVAVLTPSPHRTWPPCPYFGRCGGCQYQHADYAYQLTIKQEILTEQLRRIGGLTDVVVQPFIPAAVPWHYRNQIRLSTRRSGELGFVVRHTHRALPVHYCRITQPPINRLLALLQGRGAGLHQVVIRYGARTGEFLIQPAFPDLPDLPTGQPYYHEILLGRRYRVSAVSFFQVNTRPDFRALPAAIRAPWLADRQGFYSQADLLALLVLDRLELTGREVVVDAYCGVGTFTLHIAERAHYVIGIEESRSAVRDAEVNATGLDNVRFIEAKTEVALPQIREKVDAVVLDPARVGCAPPVIEALLALRAPKIVYVSCDPATLARDLRLLVQGGYRVTDVQPIDMFPQTHHIETVVTLRGE